MKQIRGDLIANHLKNLRKKDFLIIKLTKVKIKLTIMKFNSIITQHRREYQDSNSIERKKVKVVTRKN